MVKKDIEDQPFDEITLRSYGSIEGCFGRELVKKICLSLGLLNPNDRRDSIIDTFHVLILASKNVQWLTSKEINELTISHREEHELKQTKTAESNTRRILKQLIDFGFVERKQAKYRLLSFQKLDLIFKKIQEKRLNTILSRVTSYLRKI